MPGIRTHQFLVFHGRMWYHFEIGKVFRWFRLPNMQQTPTLTVSSQRQQNLAFFQRQRINNTVFVSVSESPSPPSSTPYVHIPPMEAVVT